MPLGRWTTPPEGSATFPKSLLWLLNTVASAKTPAASNRPTVSMCLSHRIALPIGRIGPLLEPWGGFLD